MRILIEEYQYEAAVVKDILHGIDALENIEGMVSVHYVGYFYNVKLNDCVFILPKILLKEDVNGIRKVFGKYLPEDVLNPETCNMKSEERDFIYKFAVWIYRAIVVYRKSKDKDSSIIYHQHIQQVGNGRRHSSNTFLEILLSLEQFHKDNRNFLMTTIKNIHSGYNKINWTRTISHSSAIVQKGTPVYLKPVNKKRRINFDEELLVIYFSILNYISREYGFEKCEPFGFDLIKGNEFIHYINGYGARRLKQIKYKYFSDKALELWCLCYAFFDQTKKVAVSAEQKDYLVVKSFYIVFEAIIDELIGDKNLPDDMDKKQEDGKIVDHLFTAKSLVKKQTEDTYYIGDSKYYMIDHELTDESIYKQYTYARNVIQWNLDIFNRGDSPESGIRLRDDVTEGYDIIPNFFISARMNENFSYTEDGLQKTDRQKQSHIKIQFKNRLFDRDTLLLFHYDVNFLFVLSRYARNNMSEKAKWKTEIRNRFRDDIRGWLQDSYQFYAMKAHPDVNAKQYIDSNFKSVLGKMYSPYGDEDIYSLALDKSDKENNDTLVNELKKYFYVEPCALEDDPKKVLSIYDDVSKFLPSKDTHQNGVLMLEMQDYDSKSVSFVNNGCIAVALKYTADYIPLIQNLPRVGYIMFHTYTDKSQHLFAVTEEIEIKDIEKLDSSLYRFSNEAVSLYAVVNFNNKELDSSIFHSSKLLDNGEEREKCNSKFVRLTELI